MGHPKPPKSIRRSLQVSVTVAVAVVFAAGALGVYLYVRADANGRFLSRLEERLERCVDDTEMGAGGKVESGFHEAIVAWYASTGGANPDSRELWKEGREGENIYDEHEPEDADVGFLWYVLRDHQGGDILHCPWLEDLSVLAFEPKSDDDQVTFGVSKTPGGRPLRTASISFQLPLDPLDPGERGNVDTKANGGYNAAAPENRVHLTVAQSDEGIRKMLLGLGLGLAAMGVLITAVTSVLIFYLIKRGCRPIEEVSGITAAIKPERRGSRLPEEAVPAELVPLVHQFNGLLERVDRAFERERRFSADIAHELRTPVAELRALAEVALAPSTNGSDTTDPSEDPREIYQETSSIATRMGRLIEVLSDIYRTSERGGRENHQTIRLGKVLEKAIASARAAAGRRRLTFDVSGSLGNGSDAPPLKTDPTLLRGILDNLLNNAVSYSKPGRPILCILSTAGDGVSLAIRNATSGLVSDDLPHLEEPFWRKDSVRSDANHFGLGLSTVAAYAKALGIAVNYRLCDGDFIAELSIPAN